MEKIIAIICCIIIWIISYTQNATIKDQQNQIHIYQQKNIDNILWNYYTCKDWDHAYRTKIGWLRKTEWDDNIMAISQNHYQPYFIFSKCIKE